jgi:hypothetical protein
MAKKSFKESMPIQNGKEAQHFVKEPHLPDL